METAKRIGVPLILALLVLVAPSLATSALNFSSASGAVTLAAIATTLCTVSISARVGCAASIALGLLSALGLLVSSNWLLAAIFMTLVAAGLGATARFGWHTTLFMAAISLGFVVAEPPQLADTSTALSALLLGGLVAVFALLATGFTYLITRNAGTRELNTISSSRSNAYTLLLCVSTFTTTALVVSQDWGHAGGWLIMTPLIVLQPYIQEGWSKALRRAAGTVVGFVIAYVIAIAIPWQGVLLALAVLFFAGAIAAKIKHWDYAVFAAALTTAIVILGGMQTGLVETDLMRLGATALGVGISLVLMAAVEPLYRRAAAEYELDRY